MTCAPWAAASLAASSCLSVIDSWSPDQSVWSNAALTIVMAFLLGDGPPSAGATFLGCAGPMVPTAREGRDPCSTDRSPNRRPAAFSAVLRRRRRRHRALARARPPRDDPPPRGHRRRFGVWRRRPVRARRLRAPSSRSTLLRVIPALPRLRPLRRGHGVSRSYP